MDLYTKWPLSTDVSNSSSSSCAQERPQWSREREMCKLYAFLYNSICVGERKYLPAQMRECVWRLVYDHEPHRLRTETWRTQCRLSAHAIARAVPVPHRLFDAEVRRSFEMQRSESYLCGTHSLNNVANCLLFSPEDQLSAIESLRSLNTSYCASPGALTLAALREGVFLLPIRLQKDDILSFDAKQALPRVKMSLRLLRHAGGMIIYEPGYRKIDGHYVSMTYNPRSRGATGTGYIDSEQESLFADSLEGGVPLTATDARASAQTGTDRAADSLWTIFSTDKIVSRRNNAAQCLADFMNNGSACSRVPQNQRACFVGLLPVSMKSLIDDACCVDNSRRFTRLQALDVIFRRTLLRRSLSVWDLCAFTNDLETTEPLAPAALDEMAWLINTNMRISVNKRLVERVVFDGIGSTNLASFIAQRHACDVQLMLDGEAFVGQILSELRSGWRGVKPPVMHDSEAVSVVNGRSWQPLRWSVSQTHHNVTTSTGEQQRPSLSLEQRYNTMAQSLRHVRAYLQSSPTVGLFFGKPSESQQHSLLLSNRRWLRYTALLLTTTTLIDELDVCVQTANVLNDRQRQLFTLYVFVLQCNMRAFSVRTKTNDLARKILEEFVLNDTDVLPLQHAHDYVRHIFVDNDSDSVRRFLTRNSYELSEWLLLSASAVCANSARFPQHLNLNLLKISASDRQRHAEQVKDCQLNTSQSDGASWCSKPQAVVRNMSLQDQRVSTVRLPGANAKNVHSSTASSSSAASTAASMSISSSSGSVASASPGELDIQTVPTYSDEPTKPVVDDLTQRYDKLSTFVSILRRTLFTVPMENDSFADICKHLSMSTAPKSFAQFPAPIKEHVERMVDKFVKQVALGCEDVVVDQEQALAWVDVLLWQVSYTKKDHNADAGTVATQDLTGLSKLLDEQITPVFGCNSDNCDDYPRLLYRVACNGFDNVHKHVFGSLTYKADARAPVTVNNKRIPHAAQWYNTRPTVAKEQYLRTEPLSVLKTVSAFKQPEPFQKRAKRSSIYEAHTNFNPQIKNFY